MPRIVVERGENLEKGEIARAILGVLQERSLAVPSYRASAISSLFLPKLEPSGIGRKRKNNIGIAVNRLRRQRCIEYVIQNDRNLLCITETGEKRLKHYQLNNLALRPAAHWDKIWRIVMFDIPEDKKRARDAFSQKLKDMNFHKLQKSVFVHFLPCEEEIEFIRNIFGLKNEVSLIEAKSLGHQEREIKQFFGLKG